MKCKYRIRKVTYYGESVWYITEVLTYSNFIEKLFVKWTKISNDLHYELDDAKDELDMHQRWFREGTILSDEVVYSD